LVHWFNRDERGHSQAIIDMTLKFRYNDLASLQELIGRHPGRIACVLMEAETDDSAAAGYLEAVKKALRRTWNCP